MKTCLKLLSLAVVFGTALVHAGPANKKCPVSGKDVDSDVTAKYTVVVGFCCDRCQAKFKKNPADEKFSKVLHEAVGKPVNTVCPVSGKDIDAEKTVFHKGQTVAFCCGNCPKKFEADPAKFSAKIKADNPANDKCPISGEDVDAETAVAHTEEIGFCCEKCLAKFEKDPVAVLTKKK